LHNLHGRDFLVVLKLFERESGTEVSWIFWQFPALYGLPQQPHFALNLHSFEQGYPLELAKGR
jgi:hypothetical protein